MVEAAAPKVVVAEEFLMSRFANAEEPVIVPFATWAEAPLKVVVPLPAVKVPLWVKLPEIERSEGAENVVPLPTTRLEVEALEENVFVPLPERSRFATAEEPVRVPERVMALEVANVVVPVPAVNVPLFA